MKKEIVICSAVKVGDKIWRGHRHNHALQAMRDELSQKMTDKKLCSLHEEQGFITSKNRYVSRKKGRKLQEAAGIKSIDENGYRGDLLFSEDLY